MNANSSPNQQAKTRKVQRIADDFGLDMPMARTALEVFSMPEFASPTEILDVVNSQEFMDYLEACYGPKPEEL